MGRYQHILSTFLAKQLCSSAQRSRRHLSELRRYLLVHHYDGFSEHGLGRYQLRVRMLAVLRHERVDIQHGDEFRTHVQKKVEKFGEKMGEKIAIDRCILYFLFILSVE